MNKIAVVLSGVGWLDGTFPIEAGFVFKELESLGLQPLPCSINKDTDKIMNHNTKELESDQRNLLDESARIVKGEITDVANIESKDIDSLIIPGGKGILRNLCDLDSKRVDNDLKELVRELYFRGVPIATLGYGAILPIIALRKVTEIITTIGGDAVIGEELEKFGTILINVTPNEIVIDEENNILSSPGISPQTSIVKGADGISQLINEMVKRKDNETS